MSKLEETVSCVPYLADIDCSNAQNVYRDIGSNFELLREAIGTMYKEVEYLRSALNIMVEEHCEICKYRYDCLDKDKCKLVKDIKR